jgi:hypothetical protein
MRHKKRPHGGNSRPNIGRDQKVDLRREKEVFQYFFLRSCHTDSISLRNRVLIYA